MNPPRFESRFYEWQALCHMAGQLSRPVLTNIREAIPNTHRLQSPEIDGLVEDKNRRILIEAKSHSLTHSDLSQILATYGKITWDELYVIAPGFDRTLRFPKNVHAISFAPDISLLKRAYLGLTISIAPEIERELATGDHHFRYVLACRKKGQTSQFRNQIDKRIRNVSHVVRDIKRQTSLCAIPVRVFWSVSRWLFPKELYFASYANQLVSRRLVFDIDGSLIHNSNTPCRLSPGSTTCALCISSAKRATQRLLKFLNKKGLNNLSVVLSGRQGFHVYVINEQLRESDLQMLVDNVEDAGIPIDAHLPRDPKAVVTFPGSIHGLSMLKAIQVEDLETFSIDKAQALTNDYLVAR